MDSLCLNAGIHSLPPPIPGCLEVRTTHHPSQICANAVAPSTTPISVEKPSVSSSQRNLSWGFSFRYPLRSLWPKGGKNTYDAAIAVKDASPVSVEEKDEKKEDRDELLLDNEGRNGNWVFKILHVRSMWKQDRQQQHHQELQADVRMRAQVDEEEEKLQNEQTRKCFDVDDECDVCTVCDNDDDEKIDFDRDSFTKLLRRVSLAEVRLYAQMSYLGNLAYSIPLIKVINSIFIFFITSLKTLEDNLFNFLIVDLLMDCFFGFLL